jgi:methionyl-tRNA formyltransferase
MKILFLGTPEIAVQSLEALMGAGHTVVAVVTHPDRHAGRGKKPTPTAVKAYALQHNLPLFEQEDLKAPGFLKEIAALKPDVGVVVAFKKLPRELYSIPRLGTLNMHGSLLPDYRGAAPIQWSIINGDTTTGVTTFLLNDEIDTGAILLQLSTSIGPDETFGHLYERMGQLGARAVVDTLEGLVSGQLQPQAQEVRGTVRPAPKILKDHTWIQWQNPAKQIHDRIRGLSPNPGALCKWSHPEAGEREIKLLETHLLPQPGTEPFGHIAMTDGRVLIHLPDQVLEVKKLQPTGKKELSAKDFLNGFRPLTGWQLVGKNGKPVDF